MSEHASITRFRAELERLEGRPVAEGRIVVLPDAVHTAQLAADALGCEVGAIANSLLFAAVSERAAEDDAEDDAEDAAGNAAGNDAGNAAERSADAAPADEPVLILTSGAHRVDTAKVAATLGYTRLRRASPEFVREHTGQVIGGVSPIAHPRPVRTFLDPALRQYAVVWAAAGHPACVFSSTYDELQRLTGAAEIEVS